MPKPKRKYKLVHKSLIKIAHNPIKCAAHKPNNPVLAGGYSSYTKTSLNQS